MLMSPDALPALSKVMIAQLMTDRAVLTPEFPGPKALSCRPHVRGCSAEHGAVSLGSFLDFVPGNEVRL